MAVVVPEQVVGEEWENENLTRCKRDHGPERKKMMEFLAVGQALTHARICGVYKNVPNAGRGGSAI